MTEQPRPPSSPDAAPLIGLVALLAIVAAVVALFVVGSGSSAALPKLPQTPPPAQPAATPAAPAPVPGEATRLSSLWGIDVSWPQCGTVIPSLKAGFAIVGVNGGRPFTDNPCLADQIALAKKYSGYSAYLNLAAPRGVDPTAYGRQSALDGLARARAAGLHLRTLWLDVEVLNHWSRDPAVNVAVINGAVKALQAQGITAGVYSSPPMWGQITGGARVDMPVWLATSVLDYRLVQPLCRLGLGGHPASFAQYVASANGVIIDVDVLCNNALPDVVRMFHPGA